MNWLKELESSTFSMIAEDFKLEELHSNTSDKVKGFGRRRWTSPRCRFD